MDEACFVSDWAVKNNLLFKEYSLCGLVDYPVTVYCLLECFCYRHQVSMSLSTVLGRMKNTPSYFSWCKIVSGVCGVELKYRYVLLICTTFPSSRARDLRMTLAVISRRTYEGNRCVTQCKKAYSDNVRAKKGPSR